MFRVIDQAFSCGRCGGGLSCRGCLGDWERESGGTSVTCRYTGTLTEPAYRLLCGEELQRLHLVARIAGLGREEEGEDGDELVARIAGLGREEEEEDGDE